MRNISTLMQSSWDGFIGTQFHFPRAKVHLCICIGPWTNSLHKVLESLVSFQTGSHYVVQASLELTALSPLPSECWSCMYAHPIKQVLWCVVSKSVMVDVNLTESRTVREIIFIMLIKVRRHTHWVWYHFLVDILNCISAEKQAGQEHGFMAPSCLIVNAVRPAVYTGCHDKTLPKIRVSLPGDSRSVNHASKCKS